MLGGWRRGRQPQEYAHKLILMCVAKQGLLNWGFITLIVRKGRQGISCQTHYFETSQLMTPSDLDTNREDTNSQHRFSALHHQYNCRMLCFQNHVYSYEFNEAQVSVKEKRLYSISRTPAFHLIPYQLYTPNLHSHCIDRNCAIQGKHKARSTRAQNSDSYDLLFMNY